MRMKKGLAWICTCVLLATVLFTGGVVELFAATTEFTVSDNGVYVMQNGINARPVTMEAVIKFPEQTSSGRLGILLGNWVYPQGGHLDYKIEADGNVRVEWGTASTTEKLIFENTNVFTGEWLHLAVVADVENQKVHCYIDGVLVQTLSTTRTSVPNCTNPFAVGNNPRQGNGYNFRGAIKSIVLYDDMRTEAEIASDMQNYGTDGLLMHFDLTGLKEGDTLTETVSNTQVPWEQKWFDTRTPVGDYDYSIAVMGDPQTVTRGDYADITLPAMYNYIVDNASAKKIQQVFITGDLTDTKTGKTSEWETITEHLDIFTGKLPLNMVRGNHDESSFYDQYITPARYGTGVTTMDGTMKNYYRTVKMGGVDFLTLALNYRPSAAERAWACEVIEEHPNHRVIITTHNFTTKAGGIDTSIATGDGGTATELWNDVVSQYQNVVLVISGHIATEDIVVGTKKGVNGNTVTHVLVDQQDADQPLVGGTGLICFMYFSKNGTLVETEYYSPTRNQYYKAGNQMTFELDASWDNTVPSLQVAADPNYTPETEYNFSVKNLSAYASDKYTASGANTYAFLKTETEIVQYLESKLHFYYCRENVVYTQRDPFTNGDTDGETRWELRQNEFLQRTTSKTTGEIFRKIDSLVPLNSLGEEIVLKDFETTFRARLENDSYGAVILGFRQQNPGKFVTGYYKFDKEQCFIAITKNGITITGGDDIVALRGGTGETDYYNHVEHSFDDPETTDVVENLGKNITVTVKVKGNYCDIKITDTVNHEYNFKDQYLPYTAAGTLAYGVSPITGSIGDISLKGYDANGNLVDLTMPGSSEDPSVLRYAGGDIKVTAAASANGYTYTLSARPVDGYELDADSLAVTDLSGNPVTVTKDGDTYTFETTGGGIVDATFVEKSEEPDTPDTPDQPDEPDEPVDGFYFAADFKELAAQVPDASYTDGVYTSTATDTAVNNWVSGKFGTFLNQEGSYYTMTHLGQPSNEHTTDTYTGNVQWQLVKGAGLGITFQNKSGQLMRKSLTLTAKDENGDYATLSDFEAEVVFNKANKNNKVGGVYISFHEKSPGRASFSSSKTPTANTGDLVIVGNALETYSYQSFGDEISVFAGVHDASGNGVREGEEMTGVNWKLDTDYKLYVKVIDTTITWTITDLSNDSLVASGSDDTPGGEGTVSVGVSGAEHVLKSFVVHEPGVKAPQEEEEGQQDNTAVIEGNTVTVKAGEGYQLKAGSLVVTDAKGNRFVPERIGFRENGDATQYKIPDNAVAPYTVDATFIQPGDVSGYNIGLVGTSVHEGNKGLRFVHRVAIDKDGCMLYNGEKVKVVEYGLLLAAEMVLADANALDLTAANSSPYIWSFAWPQANKYYDLCDQYVDLSVQITGIGGTTSEKLNIHSRVYVVLENGATVYGAPATDNYANTLPESDTHVDVDFGDIF